MYGLETIEAGNSTARVSERVLPASSERHSGTRSLTLAVLYRPLVHEIRHEDDPDTIYRIEE